MIKRLRLLLLACSLLAMMGGVTGLAYGQTKHALFIEVEAAINSATQRFITRAFETGEKEGAEVVIMRLETPGGLLNSTRKIVEVLLESPVPSVVYVAPRGARAASAGTFITAAANFAVMAPGTNIGAAAPVGGAGEDLPETLKTKVTEDAAALMRAIADERGRNSEQLERTVREAIAFSAEEAVEQGVVDFIATDLSDLLSQLDGKVATTAAGPRILDTEGLEIRLMSISILERFLLFLADPNIAFLLLSLGGLGIVLEFFNPGIIVPGVTGVILLLLAFLGLGNLPVNWAGVVFILLALVLFVLEINISGFGALGVGAIVSFLVGSFLLFFHFAPASPTAPTIGVNLWVLIPTVAVLTGGGGWVFWTITKSRRGEPAMAISRLAGARGYATTDLNPRGTVQVANDSWRAVAESDEVIRKGEEVEVVKVEGIIVTVRKA